jgi:8-hydroxy-5-deazaflavin:NADPH oxidoreductase
MRIAVIGTGSVGRTLASRLNDLGHQAVVATRDPAATLAREEWSGMDVALVPLDGAGRGADLVVNATNGLASVSALGRVGADALRGTVLLDVANPLDFSRGFPPTLSVKDDDSLAEQIQRAFPEARVVKSLNTVNASVMLSPADLPDPETTMFVAGDDADARAMVRGLLAQAGWRDVVEFDTLTAARGMEMWLPLWVRLLGPLGTATFNLKIVR